MMRSISAALIFAGLGTGPANAQRIAIDAARIETAVQQSWAQVPPDWQKRLVQDETMAACSQYRNSPPPAVADAIVAREKTVIRYPADGKFMGDWKKGEKLAQSGYGAASPTIPRARRTAATAMPAINWIGRSRALGPSARAFLSTARSASSQMPTSRIYERIYNPEAAVACANMPRFGVSGHLSIEQIKDLVAYVISPDSPVNN